MDSLPDKFLRPTGKPSRRPDPFSADEFSNDTIEQGSQAYVSHVEQQRTESPAPPLSATNTPKESDPNQIESGTQAPVVHEKAARKSQKNMRSAQNKTVARPETTEKISLRMEVAPSVRKDMIRIKHKVGIAHGVEVSYSAYFMFLHERHRQDLNNAHFLTDLAQFTEQLK